MKECFVVSGIGSEGTDVRKRADQVFKYIISPVCEECGFNVVRVDKVNQADSITQTIIEYLINSELVIADITGHNPNAFYEMGYRASLHKPMIHLKQKGENIPFDISGIRAFEYDLADLDSVSEAKDRLKKTIETMSFEEVVDNNNITVESNNDEKFDISQLLSVLYTIQDEISNLKQEIHDKDMETVQAIVKATIPTTPMEDPNMTLMKTIIPEMIKNPDSIKAIMELSKASEKNKK